MVTCEQFILDFAAAGQVFSSSEIVDSFGRKEISKTTINTILARLCNAGKIQRISRGKYAALSVSKTFLPKLSGEASVTFRSVRKQFPYASACVYEGQWLSQFMHHVASNNAIYIEVERDAAESVFEWLRSEGKNAYFRPDGNFIYRYINMGDGPIIVKVLISQSPLTGATGIPVPTLEKLMVDMYCDKDFSYLQGAEYYHIVNAAQDLYEINKNSLLRYASRRNVKEKMIKILEESNNDID